MRSCTLRWTKYDSGFALGVGLCFGGVERFMFAGTIWRWRWSFVWLTPDGAASGRIYS